MVYFTLKMTIYISKNSLSIIPKCDIEVRSSLVYASILIPRSSHPGLFCKKSVLIYFAKFTGKQMC